jgi:hypothetical protein
VSGPADGCGLELRAIRNGSQPQAGSPKAPGR